MGGLLTANIMGITQVQNKLSNLSNAAMNNFSNKLYKVGLEVEAKAKQLAPVRTGRLRSSIHTTQKNPKLVLVGSNVRYAPFVEFGTVKTPAQPYLRPALQAVKPNMNRIVGELL